jgi:hypothetical protein
MNIMCKPGVLIRSSVGGVSVSIDRYIDRYIDI